MIGIGSSIMKRTQFAPQSMRDYAARVGTGSGTIISSGDTERIYRYLIAQGTLTPTLLLFNANSGMVQRIDGVLKYIRTAFDLSATANNLDGSATATAQPRLVGGIAPNSKYAASNQNGEARKFIHTLIDFSATGIWSVSSVINLMGDSTNDRVIASDSTGTTVIKNKTTTNVFSFTNSSGATVNGTVNNSAYIGKATRWTFVANETTLKIYANAVLFDTLTVSTVAKFNTLFTSLSTKIYYYRLQSGELTAAQVLSESTFLSSLYPEIESIIIGTQTWATRNFEAVCTPMGNVIPNITVNADWSNATVLYDAAYAAEGNPALKVYSGLKAAAMWCYYNNDAANGAIYGKLYNWYAVKLLDLDMASASFGWHVPTSTEFTTLQTYLGGAAVAGGKMKMTGTDYWNTPNTGATNESGFTALGSGYRDDAGTNAALNQNGVLWTITEQSSIYARRVYILYNSATSSGQSDNNNSKKIGFSLRLIKN